MVENIKKEYVIDASFVLSFLLPDEKNKDNSSIFRSYGKDEIQLTSTFLLPYEVLNGLRTAVKRGRISEKLARNLSKRFIRYKIPLEEIDLYQVFVLSQKKNLTLYDASYAYLARNKSIPLLTLDKILKKLN